MFPSGRFVYVHCESSGGIINSIVEEKKRSIVEWHAVNSTLCKSLLGVDVSLIYALIPGAIGITMPEFELLNSTFYWQMKLLLVS